MNHRFDLVILLEVNTPWVADGYAASAVRWIARVQNLLVEMLEENTRIVGLKRTIMTAVSFAAWSWQRETGEHTAPKAR